MNFNKRVGTLLLAILILNISLTYGRFTDTMNHWSRDYIIWGAGDVQLLKGYEDGTFQPDENISRAEYMTLLNKLLQEQGLIATQNISSDLQFDDIAVDFWGYEHIVSLANYIEGQSQAKMTLGSIFTENHLRPNEPITRYEAALLTRNLVSNPLESDDTFYRDLSPRFKYYNEIMALSYSGILSGYEDNTFRPFRNMTRAESVATLKKTYDYLNSTMAQPPLEEEVVVIPPVEDEDEVETEGQYDLVETEIVTRAEGSRLLEIQIQDRVELSPLFSVDQNLEDERFINVVATLEYLSIVDFIPYDERHLYDLNPIDTLWELKNENYHNVLGTNFYLLMYDESLVEERKIELAREAIYYYNELQDPNLRGMESFFKIASGLVPPRELITSVQTFEGYIEEVEVEKKINIILAEIYFAMEEYVEALRIYEGLVNQQYDDVVVQTKIAINYGYIIKEVEGEERALSVLDSQWSEIQEGYQYYLYQDEVDEYFLRAMESI